VDWVQHVVWWQVYPLGFVGAPVRTPADAPPQAEAPPQADASPQADAPPADDAPPRGSRLDRLLPWLDYAVELGVNGLALGPVFASTSHGYDTVDHLRLDPRLGDEAAFDRLVEVCRARGLRLLLDGVFNHVGREHPAVIRALAEGPDGVHARMFRIDYDAPGGPRPAVFEGHDSLVALNHDEPAVATYVTDVMAHWLDRGADGWRLDAAYAVPPAFWARVLPAVRERHPDAWIVGEVLHGDYADVVAASGMDSVTQYELWKAIWSSLLDRNFFELDWSLQRHDGFLDTFVPVTFVGNHDVTRIAARVGSDAAVLAAVVLATVGGVPTVYYGDEQGFVAVKEEREGGDDAVRPAFPATPADLAPDGWGIYRAHQQLIGLRRRHPWLVSARTAAVELTSTRYVYRAQAADGSAALLVELDVSGTPRAVIRDDSGAVLFEHRGS